MRVFAQLDFVGFHRWKDAPDYVKYLRDVHRHVFKVRFELNVNHTERDVEFITLKQEIQRYVNYLSNLPEAVEFSCETYAVKIINLYISKHSPCRIICEVSEDGENGAIVETNAKGEILYE